MNWLARLKTEQFELQGRLYLLESYLQSEKILELSKEDYSDLRYQLFLMTQYNDVLKRRIERAK
jgi:hypothetical protein